MSDLTEFLLARIAEDEAVSRQAALGPKFAADYWTDEQRAAGAAWGVRKVGSASRVRKADSTETRAADAGMDEAEHIARHDPARVLAECEAKRRIVEMHAEVRGAPGYTFGGSSWNACTVCTGAWPCATLRALGVPYADHPAYRQEWSASNPHRL